MDTKEDQIMTFQELVERVQALSAEELNQLADLIQSLQKKAAKPRIKERIPGLSAHPDFWMSDDFNDPLPDEFWFGDESDPLNER